MKILVTGSTGFLGSNLCRALVEAGHEVRAFHRTTSSLRGLEGVNVEHALGDLAQPKTLEIAMQGMEAVFHCAGLLDSAGDAGRMYAVTVDGTRAVLDAARNAGIRRLVYTSSVASLGVPEKGPQGYEPALLDENHTWNLPPSRWVYAYAKVLAEIEVQKAVAAGMDAVIVNPSFVIGAGDVYRGSSRVLETAAAGRIPTSVPGGMNIVHIADVVEGHILALERGRTGERYILGGNNMTHTSFFTLCAELAGVAPPRGVLPQSLTEFMGRTARMISPWVQMPVNADMLTLGGMYFYYNMEKARQVLGMAEPRSARSAVEEAYAWLGISASSRTKYSSPSTKPRSR